MNFISFTKTCSLILCISISSIQAGSGSGWAGFAGGMFLGSAMTAASSRPQTVVVERPAVVERVVVERPSCTSEVKSYRKERREIENNQNILAEQRARAETAQAELQLKQIELDLKKEENRRLELEVRKEELKKTKVTLVAPEARKLSPEKEIASKEIDEYTNILSDTKTEKEQTTSASK